MPLAFARPWVALAMHAWLLRVRCMPIYCIGGNTSLAGFYEFSHNYERQLKCDDMRYAWANPSSLVAQVLLK